MPTKIDFQYILNEVDSVKSEIRVDKNKVMLENEWGRVVDKYWFKCNSCNKWTYKVYRRFIRDNLGKCTDCKGYIIKWNYEKVSVYCNNIGSTFLSSSFNLVTDKYNFKCTCCNNTIIKSFTKFCNGQTKCDECVSAEKRIIRQKTNEEYLQELKSKHIEIVPLQKYNGDSFPIYHMCPKCLRKDWLVSPSNILSLKSKSCMECRTSHGEDTILKFILDHNLNYKREFKFIDFKSDKNYSFRFDFAIFNKNIQLITLIEYDGEHHYKPARFSKDKIKMLEKFNQIQIYDSIKNKYCNKNNINILRIPYWDLNNIEKILAENELIKTLIKEEI